jgi:hypothetical protein
VAGVAATSLGPALLPARGVDNSVPVAVSVPATAALPVSAAKDRWYEDASTTTVGILQVAPPVRDAWYLEQSVSLAAPAVSLQARDRWYLDMQPARTSNAPLRHPDIVRDAWYRDPR